MVEPNFQRMQLKYVYKFGEGKWKKAQNDEQVFASTIHEEKMLRDGMDGATKNV